MFLRIPKDCCKEKNTPQYASGMKKMPFQAAYPPSIIISMEIAMCFPTKNSSSWAILPTHIHPPHLPTWVTVTSRKNSRRHQVRASSRGSLQGVRCTRVRVGTCSAYWPGIWNINMLRFWNNIKCANFATCNSILFLWYCEGWNISHIQSESSCDMEAHLLLPNNSPAVDVTSMDI